jgi:hypothetical protein
LVVRRQRREWGAFMPASWGLICRGADSRKSSCPPGGRGGGQINSQLEERRGRLGVEKP